MLSKRGRDPYQYLLESKIVPLSLQPSFCHIVEILLDKIEQVFQQVGAISYIRLHGDCHAGNVLWNNEGPHIVDLDDCLMGPAIQDIWMLVTGNTEQEVNLQLDTILRGYLEFHDFNFAEIRLIEALRALRLLHYAAWLAKRWIDPAFPPNFPWFNTISYWKELLLDLEEQIQLLEQATDGMNVAEEE